MTATEDRLAEATKDIKQARNLLGEANTAINAAQAERAELRRENQKLAEPQLPDGIEWPRFEDGVPVGIGDEVSYEGKTWVTYAVRFESGDWYMFLRSGCDYSTLKGVSGELVKHPTPEVLDADGVPIEVGDVVYYDGEPEPMTVTKIMDYGEMVLISTGVADFCAKTGYPMRLCHKRPDSWEQLEEDVNHLSPDEYCRKHGFPDAFGKGAAMAYDVFLRAKALAKAGE